MKKLLVILSGVIVIVAGGYILFIGTDSDDNNGSENNETSDTLNTTPNGSLQDVALASPDLPERDGFYAVALKNLGASFYVENDVEQVENVTVFRRFPNPLVCAFVGQQAERRYLVLAAETGSECIDLSSFEQADNRRVELDSTSLESRVYSLSGNSGTELQVEQVDLDNNVTMSFLYRDEEATEIREKINSILDSFVFTSLQ